jgi:hypothetical protein
LTTGSIALNVWSYIVGTSDGTSMRLYVNGTQVAAGLAGGPNYGGAPNFDALISRFGLPGDVADLAIYSSALSVAQIGSHYAAAGYSPGPITNLVATASTNSASLTWTTPSYAGTSPISFYSLTPVVDGKASTTITVSGNGTGANIANLPAGASYAFQVQASNASGTGVQVTSSAVTINSPGSGPGLFGQYLLLRGGPNDVQAWAHYGIVSRNNVPAMNTWTLEERLWGLNSMSTNGGHASIGVLSGTPSNPNDQSPVAGLYFDLSGTKGYFVWPGGGSCQIAPPDNQGIPLAFDGPTTTPAHVALTYDGTNIRGFINGSMVCGPVAASAALPAAPFGYMDNSGLNQAYFDEFRVSNVARWTNSFTPPTQQYTTDGNTLVLWHFNDYPISKLRTTHILARTGDDGTGYPITIIPSTYRDFSGNLNHANTIWQSGGSGNLGDDDSRMS